MKRYLLPVLAILAVLILPVYAFGEEGEISFYDKDTKNPITIETQLPDDTEQIDNTEPVYEADGSILLTMSFTGDVTLGGDVRKSPSIFDRELKKQGDNKGFMFRNVKDIFAKDDLTLINFEGTLGNLTSSDIPSNKRNNEFLFIALPEFASALKEGNIDAVALENNHVYDFGNVGYESTKQHLSEAGIVFSGGGEIGVTTVKGVEIAMLSYQTFDMYPVLFEQVPIEVAAAKEKYPIVIVSFHWGAELDYQPNANQQKLGKMTIDAGADLVIGHHSHRINPIEEYKGKYICYSLGNFSFAGNNKPSDMSTYIFQIRFRVRDGVASTEAMRIIPCRISSQSDYNDFAPTPYTGSTQIEQLLTVLEKNGKILDNPVAHYPLEW